MGSRIWCPRVSSKAGPLSTSFLGPDPRLFSSELAWDLGPLVAELGCRPSDQVLRAAAARVAGDAHRVKRREPHTPGTRPQATAQLHGGAGERRKTHPVTGMGQSRGHRRPDPRPRLPSRGPAEAPQHQASPAPCLLRPLSFPGLSNVLLQTAVSWLDHLGTLQFPNLNAHFV